MKTLTEKEIEIAVKYGINPLRSVVANAGHGLFVIEECDYTPNPNIKTEENPDDIKGINAYKLTNENGEIYATNLAFLGYTIVHHENGEISLKLEAACYPPKYTKEFGLAMDFLYTRAIELKAKTVINTVVNIPDKIVKDLRPTQFTTSFKVLEKSLESKNSPNERV